MSSSRRAICLPFLESCCWLGGELHLTSKIGAKFAVYSLFAMASSGWESFSSNKCLYYWSILFLPRHYLSRYKYITYISRSLGTGTFYPSFLPADLPSDKYLIPSTPSILRDILSSTKIISRSNLLKDFLVMVAIIGTGTPSHYNYDPSFDAAIVVGVLYSLAFIVTFFQWCKYKAGVWAIMVVASASKC